MYETRTIKASSKWSMAVGSNDLILLIWNFETPRINVPVYV